MDIDSLASEFGSANVSPNADSGGVNVNALASEFGSDKKTKEIVKDVIKVLITTPKPPISGATPEESAAINEQPGITGGTNPRDSALAEGIKNYVPAIGTAIGQNFKEGAQNLSGGLGDVVNEGQVGSGAKRMAIGGLQALTAIPAGVATEGVGKPVTELTGNPDIGDRAAFVAGSAIPIVPGAGAISKLRPSNVALKDLVENITNSGANPENLVHVVQNMKSNPRLGPADLNPAVLSATQKLFTLEGDSTKNYLSATSANRMKTSKDAVKAAYDASTGLPVNVIQKLKDLSDASKKVGTEQINPAIAGAKPVDLTDTLTHIDSKLKPGITSKITGESSLPLPEVKGALANFRKLLANDKEMRTGAQDLHDLQSALRKHADRLLNSTDSKNLGHALMEVRNKIVEDIDKASGGKYKPALAKYRDEKEIAEAFHDGQLVFTNSKKMENRPEFTRDWFDNLNAHEKEAAKEGARIAIDTEIRSAKNAALKGTDLVKSDFNKERLEILFGKTEAANLIQKLEHERLIANTHNKIVENSQTAFRDAADSRRDLPKPTPPTTGLDKLGRVASWVGPEAANFYGTGYTIPGIGLATSLALNLGSKYGAKASDAVKLALAKEGNAQYARLALPTEGPHREALIKSLEAAIPGPKKSIMSKAGSLARLVGP